uniref:ketoreductase n=1 Tax=Sporidiobolus salmonicolor TaxID=5005 RepID=UPI003D264B92
MKKIDNAVLPAGSLVLVTGANGFVGSHVVEQLLEHGYKVRGTARSASKLANLQKRWDAKYPGRFETAVVEDMLKDGAYDEVIKGAAGVAHIASPVSFSPKYDEVVPPAIGGTLNALRAAAATPSVKRFVLTSSMMAAIVPKPNVPGIYLDEKSWNLESIDKAVTLPESHKEKGLWVYAASKTMAEMLAWHFMDENKPHFTLNTVLPAYTIGTIFDPETQSGSTSGIVMKLFNGEVSPMLALFGPQHYVSAFDIGLLHLGCLVLPQIERRRVYGTAAPFDWNMVLAVFRKLWPSKTFPADFPDQGQDLSVFDTRPSLEILKSLGREGWRSFEDSIKDLVGSEFDGQTGHHHHHH